jgi:hypothetical protein
MQLKVYERAEPDLVYTLGIQSHYFQVFFVILVTYKQYYYQNIRDVMIIIFVTQQFCDYFSPEQTRPSEHVAVDGLHLELSLRRPPLLRPRTPLSVGALLGLDFTNT